MRNLARILSVGIVLGLACSAGATPIVFVVPMDGPQEAPGPGDPDGTGTALLSIDPAALAIDWNIAVEDIDFPLTGAHIHQAPAGVAGPIVVDFNGQLTGTGLVDADLAAVLANPTNYYVNIHNSLFPAGIIRGQLGAPIPAPGAFGLVALGLIGLRLARRKLA